MTVPIRIARMTSGQVLGLRRFIGLALLTLLPGVVVYFTAGTATSAGSRLEVFGGFTVGLFFAIVVPVVVLILSTSALGDERRDQTLSFIVLRPVSRSAIALAKIVGALAAACLVTGIGAFALGVAMGLRGGGWGYLIPLLLGTLIATITYGALFTPLGYLTERATLAGLAFVFIWESGVVSAVPALATTSPWRIGVSGFVAMAPDDLLRILPEFALGGVAPGIGGAALKALAIGALAVWFTAWLLRSRDLA